jgi:hypothetical protein
MEPPSVPKSCCDVFGRDTRGMSGSNPALPKGCTGRSWLFRRNKENWRQIFREAEHSMKTISGSMAIRRSCHHRFLACSPNRTQPQPAFISCRSRRGTFHSARLALRLWDCDLRHYATSNSHDGKYDSPQATSESNSSQEANNRR